MPRSGIEDDRGQLLTYARTPQVVDLVAVARIWTARHHAHLGLALRRREPLRLPYLRVQRHDRLVARPAALWRLSLQFETVAKLSFHGHSHCARLRRPVGSVQSIAIDLKSFSDPSDDFPNVFFFQINYHVMFWSRDAWTTCKVKLSESYRSHISFIIFSNGVFLLVVAERRNRWRL